MILSDGRTLRSTFCLICGINGYDMFPDLMAAAIKKEDLKQWAGDNDIVLK